MDASVDQCPVAWLPLTPGGVAAFARASLQRLLLFQLVAALLASVATVWVLSARWFPIIALGIEHLPEQGALRAGRLEWSAPSPQVLSESRYLAFAVDLEHSGQARAPSQIEVEFGRVDLRVCSVFGCAEVAYPKQVRVAFNVAELKPWWGAWAPMLRWLAAGAVLAALFISWAVLATAYSLPAWLVGLYLNRELTLGGSWRLAGAALIPGALVMAGAMVAYGLARFDLVQLAAAWAFHLLLGWGYVVAGAAAAPKIQKGLPAKGNPFRTPSGGSGENQEDGSKTTPGNPFSAKR